MKVEFEVRNEWTVVKLNGRVDSFTYPIMENDLQILLRTGAKNIILDLSKNTHMNLNGFRLIKNSLNYLKSVNGNLSLVSPNNHFLKHMDYFLDHNEIQIGSRIEDFIK